MPSVERCSRRAAPICLPVPPSSFQLYQGGKPSASADQCPWRTFFYDPTSLQHQDTIGFLGRGQAMGTVSTVRPQPMTAARKDGLAGTIDRGSGLVQQQHGRVPQQGPAEGEQLALSGRELQAAAQQRVIPLGQGLDEGVRPGDSPALRPLEHRPITQCEIVEHRASEQVHHLRDHAHGAPTLAVGQYCWVGTRYLECSAPRGVESAQQV